MRLVVDASVAIAYFVPERFSKGALLWFSGPHSLFAPDFLVVEAINVLWNKMRRGEITRAEAEDVPTALTRGDIPLLASSRYAGTAWRMAGELDHSLYDCFYLALAAAEGGVLVTADKGFHRRVAASRWADRIAWVEDPPPRPDPAIETRPGCAERQHLFVRLRRHRSFLSVQVISWRARPCRRVASQPTGASPLPKGRLMLDPMTLRGPLPAGLALAAVLCAAPSPASGADVPVDLELVLAVDVSGSVDEVEAHLQREGYVAAFGHPQVVEAIEAGPTGRIAVTYVEWAGQHHQETLVGWTLIEDKESAGTFASAIAETPLISARWTSLSGALDYAKTLFDGNGFEGLRRVIDVSGDGTNNSGRPVTDAREEALATGLTINGLPIVNDRLNPWGGLPAADLDVYYERFVIGGPGAFIVVAEDYTKFAEAILSKLILEIAGTAPPAEGTRHAAALAARLP